MKTTVTEKPAAVSAATTLRVTEIFHSLQGETSRTGLPTVFVRLTGCPLRCGYCDTAYAFHGGESLTLDEILSRVAALGAHYVTLTGGEPLAQKQAPVLLKVYEQMCEPKWVMAFGVCATSGGFYQNYAALPGIDRIIPVDVYIPGCPPRPEMVIDGIMQLQEKIAQSSHPILTRTF